MASPDSGYGDNPQQQALISLLLQDNNELEQRQDLVYDRRDMANDDAAPLPDIDWKDRPSKAMVAAAASSNKTEELNLVMQFSNATTKAAHRSDTWNKRIIDFFLVYCQFMATYTPVAVPDYFTLETIVKYAIPYLVIRAIKTKGIDAERIKARTLVTWMDGLINGIWQYAHHSRADRKSAAKEVLFKHGLARRIRAKVDQLIRVLGLSKVLRTKHILDIPDLHLIIDSALYHTRFLPGNRLVVIQYIMSWCIILYTGLRPMSLAASNRRYKAMGHYMRLRNIKIKVNGPSDWTVIVNATELKGHVVGLDHKDLTFQLRCVKKTHNVMFCAATWVVLFLWLRGAFPQYKTLRNLWTTTDVELLIEPSMLNEPFILAAKEGGRGLQDGKPAGAEQISQSLSYYAHKGFMFDITAYALRRGLANLLARLIGDAHAAVVLGHRDAETVFNKHYSRGTADIDLVGLVTREADVQPDKPGMYLDSKRHISTALLALMTRRWWSEQEDADKTQPAQDEQRKQAFGKRGEGVKLTAEQEEACKPVELAAVSDAALEKFWACFKPSGMKERNKQNANKLLKGIETGQYPLKDGVDPNDVKKYHSEAVNALARFKKAWTASRRTERQNIAKQSFLDIAARPPDSIQDRDTAEATLRKKNEEAIQRLVAAIPKDAAQQDIMTEVEMDSTIANAFQKETDDLDDVVDEYGRANPLPRATLNKQFATKADMDMMHSTFDKPFVVLVEQEEQEESEQPIVIDAESNNNGLDDDSNAKDILSDDVTGVRCELMELAATPILCARAGRPIPGIDNNTSCVECNKKYKDLRAYRNHMRWVHTEWNEFLKQAKPGKKWKCAPCNSSFKKKPEFVHHALEDCIHKDRNQAWYNEVKDHVEDESTRKKLQRQRIKDGKEGGPEALECLVQEILPDDLSASPREVLIWGLSTLPSRAEARRQIEEKRKEIEGLEVARPVLPSGAMSALKFDIKEALLAHASSIL